MYITRAMTIYVGRKFRDFTKFLRAVLAHSHVASRRVLEPSSNDSGSLVSSCYSAGFRGPESTTRGPLERAPNRGRPPKGGRQIK